MRMITDTMYYGNYKFDVELDTGSKTGANQLTVWVAEKVNIDTVPLKQFGVAQLLTALIEPERAPARQARRREICLPAVARVGDRESPTPLHSTRREARAEDL